MTTNQTEASSPASCISCTYRGNEVPAVYWCMVCAEKLCEPCKTYHENSKSLRTHPLTLIDGEVALPEFLETISELCHEHNRKFELFCSDHQVPCCIKCATIDHKSCSNLPVLEDVVANVKSSVAMVNIEDGLSCLSSKIDSIIEKKNESKKMVEMQTSEARDEVNELKDQVTKRLERSVKKILDEIENTKEDENTKTSAILEKLMALKNTVLDVTRSISKIKLSASDLTIFLALKNFEGSLTDAENKLSEMIEAGILEHKEARFKPNEALTSGELLDTFGELALDVKKLEVATSTLGQTSASELRCAETPIITNIDAVVLEKVREIPFTESSNCIVHNCVILENKTVVFCDYSYNKRLIVFDRDYQFLRHIPIEDPPFGITLGFDSSVAITLPSLQKIVAMQITALKDSKTDEFVLNGECYGIDYSEVYQYYIVAVKEYGIQMIDRRGNVIKCLPLACVSVACTGDKLIYLNEKSDIVRCCDFSGSQIWEQQVPIQLCTEFNLENSKFNSVTVDTRGSIFVCDYYSDNLFIVSNDGKQCKCLLKQSDGLYLLGGLSIDETKRQILLCAKVQSNGTLFKIK